MSLNEINLIRIFMIMNQINLIPIVTKVINLKIPLF